MTKVIGSNSLSNNTNITYHYQWCSQTCWRSSISIPIPKPSSSQNLTISTRNRSSSLIPRASSEPENGGSKKTETIAENDKSDLVNEMPTDKEQKQQQQQQRRLELEDVNPVGLGRRSRQLFDEVWRKFSGLGQISRTSLPDERDALDALLIREGPMCEFVIPGAQNTTVLVVGATSKIGRIVVRKLMLRGYTVKVSSCLTFRLLLFLGFVSVVVMSWVLENDELGSGEEAGSGGGGHVAEVGGDCDWGCG